MVVEHSIIDDQFDDASDGSDIEFPFVNYATRKPQPNSKVTATSASHAKSNIAYLLALPSTHFSKSTSTFGHNSAHVHQTTKNYQKAHDPSNHAKLIKEYSPDTFSEIASKTGSSGTPIHAIQSANYTSKAPARSFNTKSSKAFVPSIASDISSKVHSASTSAHVTQYSKESTKKQKQLNDKNSTMMYPSALAPSKNLKTVSELDSGLQSSVSYAYSFGAPQGLGKAENLSLMDSSPKQPSTPQDSIEAAFLDKTKKKSSQMQTTNKTQAYKMKDVLEASADRILIENPLKKKRTSDQLCEADPKSSVSKRNERKKIPLLHSPYEYRTRAHLQTASKVVSLIPNESSSVVHILGRRVNLAGKTLGDRKQRRFVDIDYTQLAHDWVKDNPSETSKISCPTGPLQHRPHPAIIEIEMPLKAEVQKVSTEAMSRQDDSTLNEDEKTKNIKPSLRDLVLRGRHARAKSRRKLRMEKQLVLPGLAQKGVFLS